MTLPTRRPASLSMGDLSLRLGPGARKIAS